MKAREKSTTSKNVAKDDAKVRASSKKRKAEHSDKEMKTEKMAIKEAKEIAKVNLDWRSVGF